MKRLQMPETILIIDDTEANRYASSRLLQNAGYATRQASTLLEGMDLLKAEPVDLVMLDVNLPDGSGFDMCLRLKRTPEYASLPVLMTSALFIQGRDRAQGLDCGADGYLTTPVDGLDLVATVRSLLRLRETEQRLKEALERAEKANAAKTEFLANMSHEIRTPMNAITGLATMLGRTALTNQQATFVTTLKQSADGLLALVNDLLDISKIEEGKVELDLRPFRPFDLVSKVVEVMTPQADAKGLCLKVNADTTALNTLLGDDHRIRQILLNLVSNAVKFTSAGDVSIAVQTQDDAKADGTTRLTISVTDSGIGIAPEAIEKVFDKFVQAESSTTRRFGGTGLGLPIARSLAGQMGGVLSVTSQLDLGSTFTLCLPLQRSERPHISAESTSDSRQTKQAGRVLVIDDNPANLLVASSLLETMGFQTVTVSNGKDALDRLALQSFDLALMDIRMEGMDGYETTRRYRKVVQAASAPRLPIIATTANVMAGEREKCLAAGMDDYLAKPFNIARFEEMLTKYVRAGTAPAEPSPTRPS